MMTNATTTLRSSVNRSVEATSSRTEDGAEGESGGRSVLAMTDADFPRVLNGPAPGYAEDALRRLLAVLPAEGEQVSLGTGRRRHRSGAPKRAPAASGAIEEVGQQPLDWGAGAESGSASGAAGLESAAAAARASGLEARVGAALSEGLSWEYNDGDEEEKEGQQHQVTRWICLSCCWTLVPAAFVFGDWVSEWNFPFDGSVCRGTFSGGVNICSFSMHLATSDSSVVVVELL